jgi:molecular chaperone HscB
MRDTCAEAREASVRAMQNHFELFGLPSAFQLDADSLERRYREIQSQVHPDRYAHAGDAERRASLQWTTRVNEAYRTLNDPVQRAKHLLELHGIDLAFETNTRMPAEFLGEQLELREELEGAVSGKDAAALDRMRSELGERRQRLEREIAETIDSRRDYAGAAGLVRKLMFLHRLDAEIEAAYEEVE